MTKIICDLKYEVTHMDLLPSYYIENHALRQVLMVILKFCHASLGHIMGYRPMDETTISRLRIFVNRLNMESANGSIIVVEGKRDVEALVRVGFTGNITVLNRYKGINNFVDNHNHLGKKIILLLDMDRTGKYLTSKLLRQMQPRGGNISLFYKKTLAKISNGKIRHIEDLISYAPHVLGFAGARKDLYMYV